MSTDIHSFQPLPSSELTALPDITSYSRAGADNVTSTMPSSSSSGSHADEILRQRGSRYPRAQHNFEVDPKCPHSHWRRIGSLNDNVLPYLLAHGLPRDRAEREMSREYVQRWRLIRTVRDSAGGGAVYEINTDWGRRKQVYEIDDAGWDEDCPDDSALFGRSIKSNVAVNGCTGTTASVVSGSDSDTCDNGNARVGTPRDARRDKIHRRSQWEGRSFITSTMSPSGGLVERTERYLASAETILTAEEQNKHLPAGTDDTVMVVERTFSPEDVPEIVSCREVFIRNFHVMEGKDCDSDKRGECQAIPILSCPFDDVVSSSKSVRENSQSTISAKLKRDGAEVRVRTILIPIFDSSADFAGVTCKTEEENLPTRYRVWIEGDSLDLSSRGLLGLLSDFISDMTSAHEVLNVNPANIRYSLNMESLAPFQIQLLENTTRLIQQQISSLLSLQG